MNGAESLVRTAVDAGVEVCFTNPGTTEMPLVAALDTVPGIRGVLALFEGVVTGAADGYGRMAEKPALTLLHLGPGFANGIANLHNARRARTPIVNLIGDQATWHRNHDAPLSSDIESLARPVSGWVRSAATARDLSRDLVEALTAAARPPGQVATLAVPSDCQWDDAPGPVIPYCRPAAPRAGAEAVEEARRAVTADDRTLLLLGGHGLRRRGLEATGRILALNHCRAAFETFPSRLERGPHLPTLDRMPYFPEQAQDFLKDVSHLVLAGAADPVAFFGYRGAPSRMLAPDIPVTVLARPTEDVPQALEDLAAALDAPATFSTGELSLPERPTGELNAASVSQAICALQPEGAIVVDEGITSAGAYYPISRGARPHTYLTLTGGSIGMGIPCATGAALACPDRQVLVLEGDGSGLYTVQALWTQARESLNVVNLVFANDIYRILQIELARAGVTEPGPQGTALTDLGHPSVDWVALSRSLGVPARRAESADELVAALEAALAEDGPHLVEVRMP